MEENKPETFLGNVNNVSVSDEDICVSDILKDECLLNKIIDAVHSFGIVGEENNILVLTNKINLRLVRNATPTSSNILVTELSGGGKDALVDTLCKLIVPESNMLHMAYISPKSLLYYATDKKYGKSFTWNEKVFYLEDPPEETIQSQIFKIFMSGKYVKGSTVIDGKGVTLGIKGKAIFIITSFTSSINLEGKRRLDSIRLDISNDLTKQVVDRKLEEAEGLEPDYDIENEIQSAILQLKPYEVIVPYATKLKDYLPNNLIMRTQVSKLLDYIKSSTILHQYQRETDEKGRLIANWFDYEYGRYVFTQLKSISGQVLNPIEQELINILYNAETPLSLKEVSEKFSHSLQWIYKNLDNLKSRGLVKEVFELDTLANKEIRKIYTECEEGNIELPNALVLNGFKRGVENHQQEGFNGFNRFKQIIKEINNKGVENPPTPLEFVENRRIVENLSVEGNIKPIKNRRKPTWQPNRVNGTVILDGEEDLKRFMYYSTKEEQ